MHPSDNCEACACIQDWRFVALWMTDSQSRCASAEQAAFTAAVTAKLGFDPAKRRTETARAARSMEKLQQLMPRHNLLSLS
jgi:hypothetical protein